MNGETYTLEVNNAINCNHSGSTGWDSSVFQTVEVTDTHVTFYLECLDGRGGFPGNLKVWICYTLAETGEFEVAYKVIADKDTLVNPTNHSYFNLTGNPLTQVGQHEIKLHIEGIYPVNEVSIPEQELDRERGFVKDLQAGIALGKIFANPDPQLAIVNGGLDHPFKLSKDDEAVSLYEPISGRYLTIRTDCSTVVVYTANYPDERFPERPVHNGIALEMQAVPDAIHRDEKDQVILRAGEVFTRKTSYFARTL